VHDKNEWAFSCLIRTKATGKDKVHPPTYHGSSDRELIYISTLSLTSELDGGG